MKNEENFGEAYCQPRYKYLWTKTESQSEAYSKIRVDKIQKTISLMTLPLTEKTSFGVGFFLSFLWPKVALEKYKTKATEKGTEKPAIEIKRIC